MTQRKQLKVFPVLGQCEQCPKRTLWELYSVEMASCHLVPLWMREKTANFMVQMGLAMTCVGNAPLCNKYEGSFGCRQAALESIHEMNRLYRPSGLALGATHTEARLTYAQFTELSLALPPRPQETSSREREYCALYRVIGAAAMVQAQDNGELSSEALSKLSEETLVRFLEAEQTFMDCGGKFSLQKHRNNVEYIKQHGQDIAEI